LVTLFSAPNYCGEFDNAGGMMSVDATLMCSFQVSSYLYNLITIIFIFTHAEIIKKSIGGLTAHCVLSSSYILYTGDKMLVTRDLCIKYTEND